MMPFQAMRLRQQASGGGGGTDPFFANVVALLPLDGANGTSTITDVVGNAWTASGAVFSNASAPFGSTSLFLDGVDDFLVQSVANSGVAFGTGNFTVECLAASLSGTVNYQTLCQMNSNEIEALIVYGQSGYQTGQYYRNGLVGGAGTTAADLGAWKHVAYCRNLGTGTVFYDGIPSTNTVSDTVNFSANGVARVGVPTAGLQAFSGYIKALRITKGVARYTAAFSPPTGPFPTA